VTSILRPPEVAPPEVRSARRRRGVALVALVLVVGIGGAVWIDHRHDRSRAAELRAREWQHGGDDVSVSAQISAARGASFATAYRAAGGRGRLITDDVLQGYVVRVDLGSAPDDGSYHLALVDTRAEPRPFFSAQPWNWNGEYNSLSAHYSWLADTAAGRLAPGTTIQPVTVRPVSGGVYGFYSDAQEGGLATEHPETDLVLALFHVDEHGAVRWAKKVPLTLAR
jgi:hypothetical protein